MGGEEVGVFEVGGGGVVVRWSGWLTMSSFLGGVGGLFIREV